MFQKNRHITDHWKGLEFEITDFDYQDDRIPSAETIPTQISSFEHVEIINVSQKKLLKKSHWKDLELGITDFGYQHDRTPST